MAEKAVTRKPNKRVRESVGTSTVFDKQLVKEVSKKTGMPVTDVNYILDNYREIIIEHLKKGRRVELKRFGYFVFWLKKGWFSVMAGRTLPEMYYIKFIFSTTTRNTVRENVTTDLIPPPSK